jgi:hypothetical protein
VPHLTAGDCDVAVAGLLEGHLPSSRSRGGTDKARCNRRSTSLCTRDDLYVVAETVRHFGHASGNLSDANARLTL